MNAPTLVSLSAQQLRQAAELKARIETLQAELSRLGGTPAPLMGDGLRTRRKMSKAAIARISASQRARWARIKRTKGAAPAKKPTRRISAAGRARLAALARARWAKVKASGRSKL